MEWFTLVVLTLYVCYLNVDFLLRDVNITDVPAVLNANCMSPFTAASKEGGKTMHSQ